MANITKINGNNIQDARVDSLPTFYSGTTEPSDTLGKDGDIYIMYNEE